MERGNFSQTSDSNQTRSSSFVQRCSLQRGRPCYYIKQICKIYIIFRKHRQMTTKTTAKLLDNTINFDKRCWVRRTCALNPLLYCSLLCRKPQFYLILPLAADCKSWQNTYISLSLVWLRPGKLRIMLRACNEISRIAREDIIFYFISVWLDFGCSPLMIGETH